MIRKMFFLPVLMYFFSLYSCGALASEPGSSSSGNSSSSIATVLPVISITNPVNNGGSTNQIILVSGRASSTNGITNVFISLNNSPFSIVSGTTNWFTNLTLNSSNNIIKSYAIDLSGNSSLTQQINYYLWQPAFIEGVFSGNAYEGWKIMLDNYFVSSTTNYYTGSYYSGIYSNTPSFKLDVSGASNDFFVLFLYKDHNSNGYWDNSEFYYFNNFISNWNISQTSNIGSVDVSVNNIRITIDDTINSNAQINLFGTFDTTNKGFYTDNIYGDVMETPYAMFDDGTHGDDTANDYIWTLNVNLYRKINYTFKFSTSNASPYCGATSLYVSNADATNLTYTIPSKVLKNDVYVKFIVSMSNYAVPLNVSVRGSVVPLSWSANNVNLNDSGISGDAVAGDKIWTGLTLFASGSASFIEYKYVTTVWESRANRYFIIDSAQLTNSILLDKWSSY